MSIREAVVGRFQEIYGHAPEIIVRAPGRVNLIGEHTDYNDGFVLPMAINRAIWIAARRRDDGIIKATLLDFDNAVEIDLTKLQKAPVTPAEYIKGVAWALNGAGFALTGWEGVIGGDIPVGAGLSSSAALEMAVGRVFEAFGEFEISAPRLALVGQQAENEWVGVSTGIMDQMSSASGDILLIDCRSLETQTLTLPNGTVAVVLDTATRRGLVDSAYNERRSQCEAAAAHFGVPALRDVTLEQLTGAESELDALIYRRARHIVSENERVLAARDALVAGDAKTMGDLMQASHVSMRDDFEISSDALNQIVEAAMSHDACIGARMTGAGFGGCGVALVQADAVEEFLTHVEQHYQAASGVKPNLYFCTPSDGAGVV